MLAMTLPRRIVVIEKEPETERTRPGRMSQERLEWHLHNWTQYMFRRVGTFRALWYPGRASSGIGRSSSSDFDQMVEHADARCARVTYAIINDLPRPQCLAIHHKHLGSVYRVRYDLDKAYAEGCVAVGRELTKRGID